MPNLPRGANAPLPPGPVAVTVTAAVPVDVSALLVTGAGTVRDDADFVFYNQRSAAGVRYRPDGVDVAPTAVEAAIERVVVVASLDGRGPATFGLLGGLRCDVVVGGRLVAVFAPDGLGPETALLCVELYRRAGAWKVRAVGQGYADGLAGIATDFGIVVTEPVVPEAVVPEAVVPEAVVPEAVVEVPNPAVRGLPPVRGRGAAAPASHPPFVSPARVNLDKGRVSLQKRQTVSLVKTGAPPLRRVAMGLGWDPARRGHDIDLDASVIVVDARGAMVDAVWFMAKSAYGGAIEHSGDNLTGQGDGDDETIVVDLARLPVEAHALVFTVNSFQGQHFTEVVNAYCRLRDVDGGAELVRFDLTESKPRTGVIMAVLVRVGATWDMTAIGEFHEGRTARAMYAPAQALVSGLLGRPAGTDGADRRS